MSMFLLVTGASGVGKSTVRRLIEPEFAGVLEIAELASLGVTPQWNVAWRHQMVERIVRRALEAQCDGKPFLLCGDPEHGREKLAGTLLLLEVVAQMVTTRLTSIERGE